MMNQIIVEMKDWALSDVIVLDIKSGQRVDVNALVGDVMDKTRFIYACSTSSHQRWIMEMLDVVNFEEETGMGTWRRKSLRPLP